MIQIAEWPGAQRGSQRVFATAELVVRPASCGSAYTDHNESGRLAIGLGGAGIERSRSSLGAPPSRAGCPSTQEPLRRRSRRRVSRLAYERMLPRAESAGCAAGRAFAARGRARSRYGSVPTALRRPEVTSPGGPRSHGCSETAERPSGGPDLALPHPAGGGYARNRSRNRYGEERERELRGPAAGTSLGGVGNDGA